MVGYLSPEGEFIEPRSVDTESLLGLGYIAFKAREVYMRRFRKNYEHNRLTVKQIVWIEENRKEFNVHQKIDLMKIMDER